jgi:hypothetical protein
LNRYSYVFNNPLSFTDPSGFFCGTLDNPCTSADVVGTKGRTVTIFPDGRTAGQREFILDPGQLPSVPSLVPGLPKDSVPTTTGPLILLPTKLPGSADTVDESYMAASTVDGKTAATRSVGTSEPTVQISLGPDGLGFPIFIDVPISQRAKIEAEVVEQQKVVLAASLSVVGGPVARAVVSFGRKLFGSEPAPKELTFGRKLDFLFNRNIDQSNAYNAGRAAGNAERIGIADTPANRAEVTRRFNEAYNDPGSIVGPGKTPGSTVREFFLPGVTSAGSKIQFVEQGGKVITIIAK